MNIIYLLCWNMSTEDLHLMNKIQKYFGNLLVENDKTFVTQIDDIKTIGGELYENPCIVFGKECLSYCDLTKQSWLLPSLKSMRVQQLNHQDNKLIVFEKLTEIAEEVNENDTIQESTNTYVNKDNVKVGNSSMCDIQITEQEAKHLKNIKSILGGGTIVIKKGDIELEIT